MTVDDAQTTRIEQADDDPFGTEQLGNVGEQALVEDLGLLDSPAEAVDGHPLPRREELRELVDLVAERDARQTDCRDAVGVDVRTIRNRRLTGPTVATKSATSSSVAHGRDERRRR